MMVNIILAAIGLLAVLWGAYAIWAVLDDARAINRNLSKEHDALRAQLWVAKDELANERKKHYTTMIAIGSMIGQKRNAIP